MSLVVPHMPSSRKSAQSPSTHKRTRSKISFAPLPDPRRAVLVTDEGVEIPLFNCDINGNADSLSPYEFDALTPASIPAAVSVTAHASPSQPSAALYLAPPARNDHIRSPSADSCVCASDSGSIMTNESHYASSQTSTVSSILNLDDPSAAPTIPCNDKERTESSSHKRKISSSIFIGIFPKYLFRPSSLDGHELRRYPSTSSSESLLSSLNPFSSSCKRPRPWNTSLCAPANKVRPSYAATSRTIPTVYNEPGIRMLNGRVYGANRHRLGKSQTNPFANMPIGADPEFIEWGYGGGGQKNRIRQSGGCVADEEGSGMAWVRKRRAQREQERLLQIERDRQAKLETDEASPVDECEEETIQDDHRKTSAGAGVEKISRHSTNVLGRHTSAQTITSVCPGLSAD